MNLREFIEKLEGRDSKAYPDSKGKLTIGVGHLLTRDELESGAIHIGDKWVQWYPGLSEEQIDTLFDQDIYAAKQAVDSFVHVKLTECQRVALTSWVFNVGVEAFLTSTLLKKLNAGHPEDVPAEMRRWCKVTIDGELCCSKGLETRREKEAALWMCS